MSRRLRSRNKRAAAALFDSEAEESDGEQDSGSATTEANGINLTTENGGDVSGSESDGDDHLEDTAKFATAKSDLISTRLDNILARVNDLESGYARLNNQEKDPWRGQPDLMKQLQDWTNVRYKEIATHMTLVDEQINRIADETKMIKDSISALGSESKKAKFGPTLEDAVASAVTQALMNSKSTIGTPTPRPVLQKTAGSPTIAPLPPQVFQMSNVAPPPAMPPVHHQQPQDVQPPPPPAYPVPQKKQDVVFTPPPMSVHHQLQTQVQGYPQPPTPVPFSDKGALTTPARRAGSTPALRAGRCCFWL